MLHLRRAAYLAFLSLFFAVLAPAGTVAALDLHCPGNPENIVRDDQTGYYYLSVLRGRPQVKSNKGLIVRVSPDGSGQESFIEGGRAGIALNAPKGMLLRDNTLWVADIDHVRAFDKTTGALKADIDLTSFKVKYLNDISAGPDNRIFVSETIGNIIFTINPDNENKVEVFAKGKELDSPNGMVYNPKSKKLLVTLGPGTVGMLDMEGKLQRFVTLPAKGLTGIDIDEDGNTYVSSFTRGLIFKITPEGKYSVLAHGISSPTKISIDRKNRQLLVPSFLRHKVVTIGF